MAVPRRESGDVTRERPRATLTAVYYDTDDLRLARSRVTLRRRTGGGDSGWHLKLPPVDSRHRRPRGGPASAVGRTPRPGAERPLRTGGRPHRWPAAAPTARPSRPGARPTCVHTDRRRAWGRGRRRPRHRHRGLAGGDGATESSRSRCSTSPTCSSQSSRVLTAGGAEPSASQSKGIRALVGDASLPALIEIGDRPRPKDPAADAVGYHVRTQVSAIITQDHRVRRHLPDSVHQYRVAARRLRSVLQAFAPLVDDEWARALRTELGWIASVLSAVTRPRGARGAARRCGASTSPGGRRCRSAGRHPAAPRRRARRGQGVDRRRPWHRPATVDLMAALHARRRRPPRPPSWPTGKASAVLPPLAQASWRKLAKQGRRLHNELEGHDDHWHRTRITAKRARYTVEACVPVFGGPAKKFAKQLEYVTELLGEHQDAAIAAELVQQLATEGARSTRAVRTRRPVRAAAQPGRRHPPRVRRLLAAGGPPGVAQLDGGQVMSRTPIVAAGCLITRTGPDGTRGAPRPPAPLRRLVAAQGQGGRRRAPDVNRGPGSPGGDRPGGGAAATAAHAHLQGRRRPQGGPLLAGRRRRGERVRSQ